MTPTRWVIVFFWIFVGAMIIKSILDSEAAHHQAAIDHPQQKQFFFTPPPGKVAPAAVNPNADVRQIGYTIQDNTPGAGSFTYQVTLKNVGSRKATAIQIHVRPFRGAINGDEDVGHATALKPLQDSDPMSQYGSWITFPDLAPGESSTQSAIFMDRPNLLPGKNPNPEITFETVKN
jgi:hypothetical protein